MDQNLPNDEQSRRSKAASLVADHQFVPLDPNWRKKYHVNIFKLRGLAFILDAVICLILLSPLFSLLLDWSFVPATLVAIYLIFLVLYGALLESSDWKFTIGKRIMGIQISRQNGYPFSFQKSVARNFFKLLLSLSFVLIIPFIAQVRSYNKTRKLFHDHRYLPLVGSVIPVIPLWGKRGNRKKWWLMLLLLLIPVLSLILREWVKPPSDIIIDNTTLEAKAQASPENGPAPLTVQFTGSGSTHAGTINYLWEFNDGSTSRIADPKHSFANHGIYNIRLTIVDSIGRKGMDSVVIRVGPTFTDPMGNHPVAFAVGEPLSGPAPLKVNFKGSGSTHEGPASYLWEFNDGSIALTADTTHIFNEEGDYKVRLTVKDSLGRKGSDSIAISVRGLMEEPPLPPIAVATADLLRGEPPLRVRFSARLSTHNRPVNYRWDFDDGSNNSTTTENETEHIFDTVGEYSVSLTVTDIDNPRLTHTDTLIIKVKVDPPRVDPPPPVKPVAIASASPLSGTAPLTVTFNGSGSTHDRPLSYLWDFGDGTPYSTTANAVHNYTKRGNYTAKLTVTDEDNPVLTHTTAVAIKVEPSPPVAIISQTPRICSCPFGVDFSGERSSDAVGIVGYSWNFGDGNTSTEANPQHTFVKEGTYKVELTVTNIPGLTHTSSKEITVGPAPIPKLEYDSWMKRLDSLRKMKAMKDTGLSKRKKESLLSSGLNRDSVYLIGIRKSKDEHSGLLILLDSNKVYKFSSPFVPIPVGSATASLLKIERYKYKSPTPRRQEIYGKRDWLGGERYINPYGKCADFQENRYVKLFDIIHIVKDKSEFYYISLEEGDLDEEAKNELNCAIEILKPDE